MTKIKYSFISVEEDLEISEFDTNEAIPHLAVGVEFFISSDHWPNENTKSRLQEVINIRLVHPEWLAERKQLHILVYCKGKEESFPV